MADARNALTARDNHIWSLRFAIVFLSILLLVCLVIISNIQRNLRVDVPPDLSKGAHLKPDELDPSNSYAFALYVWRGINDWPKSGKDDFKKNIDAYQCYLTPAFYQQLKKQLDTKSKQGELDRTRSLSSPLAFDPSFVTKLGNNSFTVALAMELQERVDSMPVKDLVMLYSLRVVPDNRACNPMGRALDGFAQEPSRVEAAKTDKLKN